jgi:hypothetical protein
MMFGVQRDRIRRIFNVVGGDRLTEIQTIYGGNQKWLLGAAPERMEHGEGQDP